MDKPKTTKSKRGFASMSSERQREIARKGGKSVPAEKRAFSNPEIAAAAGRKGGSSVDPKNRAFSRDPALAAAAGTKGGHASHGGKGRLPSRGD
jgi:general stress protein YciG